MTGRGAAVLSRPRVMARAGQGRCRFPPFADSGQPAAPAGLASHPAAARGRRRRAWPARFRHTRRGTLPVMVSTRRITL
jgi:hypothetical protein